VREAKNTKCGRKPWLSAFYFLTDTFVALRDTPIKKLQRLTASILKTRAIFLRDKKE